MDETTQDVSAEQVTDANPQEQQDIKKPFLKTWKPWVIALALIFFWAWCQNPANSYDAQKQRKARAEFSANIESNIKAVFDGYKISENEDTLVISVWNYNVSTYSAAVLILTGDTKSISQMEDRMLVYANTLQDTASKMGTGYTIKLRLMDGSDTDSPLCVIQNGEFIRRIVD